MEIFIKGKIYKCNYSNSIFRLLLDRGEKGIVYNEGYVDRVWLDKTENKEDIISNFDYLHKATRCTTEEANTYLSMLGISHRFELEEIKEEEEVIYEIY